MRHGGVAFNPSPQAIIFLIINSSHAADISIMPQNLCNVNSFLEK